MRNFLSVTMKFCWFYLFSQCKTFFIHGSLHLNDSQGNCWDFFCVGVNFNPSYKKISRSLLRCSRNMFGELRLRWIQNRKADRWTDLTKQCGTRSSLWSCEPHWSYDLIQISMCPTYRGRVIDCSTRWTTTRPIKRVMWSLLLIFISCSNQSSPPLVVCC